MKHESLAEPGKTPIPVLKLLLPSVGKPIRIDRAVCIVGSHCRVHLPLHSPLISRTHALIVVDGSETYIRDLASRNGLFINGHAMRESRLRHGDLLCVGPFAFWWISRPTFPKPRHLMAHADGAATLTISGESEPRRIENRSVLIGRRNECDIVLPDNSAEETHAVVYARNGKSYLRDLNSKEGSFVNGRRVRSAELFSGDQVRIGSIVMTFEPPVPAPFDIDMSARENADSPGLAGSMQGDRPVDQPFAVSRSCLTIEELLGVAPGRAAHWKRMCV